MPAGGRRLSRATICRPARCRGRRSAHRLPGFRRPRPRKVNLPRSISSTVASPSSPGFSVPRSSRRTARGGVDGAGANDFLQRHAEAKELRHGHQHVVGRPADRGQVHVRGDHVRQEAVLQHRHRGRETERAAAVADVEDHAAGTGLQHVLADASVGCGRGVGERAEAVRQDVALARAASSPRRAAAAARRDGSSTAGRAARATSSAICIGTMPERARGVAPDPNLDADDEVRLLLGDFQADAGVQQAEILALADAHVPVQARRCRRRRC